ncbi:hypothetical protein FHR81_005241 [Actinoalloteichus hoggarensis]|uniref:Uncharacterized protein n=1 Tax=Actinoalloteichus hoggarensis TaxID=1470176 RepID=A0A221WAM3_9PSEU|nr:DUF1918 domain-containing protein [Actinoalloteichus hoggarensis]ASO22693.1 hypothetical protein AHOG_25440 [Actinoalloteichus hoggarensis]MBB5924164.1 hypothetical protein [Actinoalloteichus hoggarensis]
MHAAVGDQIHLHGRVVGQPDRFAEIREVRGSNGEPPYLVVYPDGTEALVYPGPDCEIEQRGSTPA